MSDLILDARITSLEASLVKVQNLLSWATRRQRCLEDMDKLLQESIRGLQQSRASIERYISPELTKAQEADFVPTELELADKAIAGLNKVVGNLKKGQDKLKPLSKVWTKIRDRDAALEVRDHFKVRAEELLSSLGRLNKSDGGVWSKYDKDVRMPAQGLFAEFSEFLAGLALRDSGFDEDICEVADELLKSFTVTTAGNTELLTIASPHEITAIPLAEILKAAIQLSYPEWTFWSLPVVANEFWRAVASQQQRLRSWFQTHPQPDGTYLNVDDPSLCLADAFATCSMGPAYAYYAFLLSLNPVNALSGTTAEPSSAMRAEAILAMLQSISGQDAMHRWAGIANDLRKAWDLAVAAALPSAEPLKEEVRAKISNAASSLEAALSGTRVPFGVENWAHIETWKDFLEAGKPDLIVFDSAHGMRDVINAAWLARQRVTNPNRIEEIAKAAYRLRERISLPRSQAQGDSSEAA